MYDIPLDFSALSNLYCGRRYQFSCVRGMNSSSVDTDFGSACHEFFEQRNKGNTAPVAVLAPSLVAKWRLTDTTKFMLTCLGFDQQPRPQPIKDTANNLLAEYKFSIPYATQGNYRIVLCGTMDLVYNQDNRFLVIRDYKTTKALGAAAQNIVDGYTSSLQLSFYAYALHKYLHAFLPDTLAEMALALRLTGEYLIVYSSAASPKFERTPLSIINQDTINSVEALIHNAIPRIVSIYEHNTIYPPEGSMYKLCPKCPYHLLCLAPTYDELVNRVNNVPTRPYDPTNFR